MRFLLPALSLGLAALAAGCGDDTTTGQARAGTLDVYLTDAPTTTIDKAVVTIAEVSLRGGSDTVVLASTPVTVDLLTLADTVRALVQGAEVPGGRFDQLRLRVSGGYIQVRQSGGAPAVFASSPDYAGLPAGTTVTGALELPSLESSGLEVALPETVAADGGAHAVVLDFDVAQSFGGAAGLSNRWVMRPVIRSADLAATGRIVLTLRAAPGVVFPAVAGRVPTLADFGARLESPGVTQLDSLPFTDPDGDGTYTARFAYQLPGDYAVRIRGPEGLGFAVGPEAPTVHLAAGAVDSVALVLTGAGSPATASAATPRTR